MAIDLIFYQALQVDPTTKEHKKHADLALIRGQFCFGTHVVLACLSTYTLSYYGRMVENPSKHLPPTRDIVPGGFTPYPILNHEHLPIENCFEV